MRSLSLLLAPVALVSLLLTGCAGPTPTPTPESTVDAITTPFPAPDDWTHCDEAVHTARIELTGLADDIAAPYEDWLIDTSGRR